MAVHNHGRQDLQGGAEAGFASMRRGAPHVLRGDTEPVPVCGTDGRRCIRDDEWLQAMLEPQAGPGMPAHDDEDIPVCGSCGQRAMRDDAWLGRLLH